MLYTSIEPLLN